MFEMDPILFDHSFAESMCLSWYQSVQSFLDNRQFDGDVQYLPACIALLEHVREYSNNEVEV